MITPDSRERPILVALVLCILGILWCFWLYKLHPSLAKSNAKEDIHTPTLKCHQVYPMIRTTLFVFAIFLSCSSLFYILRMLISSHSTAELWIHKGLPIVVLLVLFLAQILHIVRIRQLKTLVVANCSKNVEYQYYILFVFALIQIGIGMYFLFM